MHLLRIKNNSCDLFSNFLTHSFFSLLEQCYLYELSKLEHPLPISNELTKAIKSFLFILKTSKDSMALLEKQIFTYYMPYHYRTKSQILNYMYLHYSEGAHYLSLSKSHLTLPRAKKGYMQVVSRLKKHHEYDKITACNIAFIKLYLAIIYHSFPTASQLPDIFRVYTAEDFSKQLSHYTG
ncbi:hypothetical protein [Cellulosilyticum sp. I15G10I2]|uniref:hypothetical protein n=1 Tax=Cellulosilyticum sp. I15G10I2 TaxID=1892843 RepID=UPI00085CD68A|nr:hypothetical protein [Cellulosilyticum sp. I15G10I2]